MRLPIAGFDAATRPLRRATAVTALLVIPVIYPRFGQPSAILIADITAPECPQANPGESTWNSMRSAYAAAKRNADKQFQSVLSAVHQFTSHENGAVQSHKMPPLVHAPAAARPNGEAGSGTQRQTTS